MNKKTTAAFFVALTALTLGAQAQQVLGDFTSADQFEWPKVIFYRDLNANWDDGIIKTAPNTGGISRGGFGIHMHESRQFSFWSTNFNPLLSIEGGSGNTYIRGNVGIGTINPKEKLVVNGTLKVVLDESILPERNVVSIKSLEYSGISGARNWALRSVYQYGNGVGANAPGGDLDILKSQDGNTILATKTDGKSLGNVGVGLISPSEKLVVNGNFMVVLDENTLPERNVVGIKSLDVSGVTGARNWTLRSVYQYGNGIGTNAAGGDLDILKSQDGNTILATKTDGTPLGNIGIGTTKPRERLSVNGNIRAKEIQVESNNWPDYVFETDYKITPLADIEQYVKIHKHLPEIPNAQTVENEGIQLGELNKILLKKLEELTLHLIEQEKKINMLSSELKKLKQ